MRSISLIIFIVFATNAIAQDCSDLFISEYAEGPHNNNAIEIYNPTNSQIDLEGYTINRYSNGSPSSPQVFSLSGSIAAGDVMVVGNGQLDSVWVASYWSMPVYPVFYNLLDDHCDGDYDANSTFYFNGDDAMTLEFNGNIVDVFGKVGEDPGSAWTDDASAGYTDANGGDWWTKRKTLVRKSSVKKGVTQNPILFNPTLEYDLLPDSTYTNLGTHTCDCSTTSSIDENKSISFVVYPNPAKSGSVVTINGNKKIEKIDVINILGEKVATQTSDKITTTNLERGIYIINILFTDGRIVDNKLIVE